MKRLMATTFAVCVFCAAGPVAAEPGARGERMARPEGATGAMPARERVRPPARDANWPQRQRRVEGQEDHGGRMSPEERRQLRRDISAHGRDIYRERKE